MANIDVDRIRVCLVYEVSGQFSPVWIVIWLTSLFSEAVACCVPRW